MKSENIAFQSSNDGKTDSQSTHNQFENFQQIREPSKKETFQEELGYTLQALLYKSIKLQSRQWCSNICQIISPLVCLLFTIAVKAIMEGMTTGAVKTFEFPQPFNLPVLSSLSSPSLGLSCKEVYYYETNHLSNSNQLKRFMEMQLNTYCDQIQALTPIFKKQNNTQAIMNLLQIADKEQFQRGNDLTTQIPDGLISFHSIHNSVINVTLAINDFRLPEYHKNNGVTKIKIKTSSTSEVVSYLRVTEAMMSLIQKITRPFLQMNDQKQIIMGSYLYMPFSGEDKALINKSINLVGSGLYPLGLSLLLPLLLFTIVAEKQAKLIQIMKMNGLNIKIYWIHFFIYGFVLSLLIGLIIYVFGAFVLQIDYFSKTSWSVIGLLFVVWGIAQVSLTTFIQIFINSAKSGTIVGYILSIFSTLIGVVISNTIYPFPSAMPFYLLIYPPFALCRAVYLIGFTCSENTECYKSIYQIHHDLQICYIFLASWFFIFLFSIWLNQIVQQQYGVAKRPLLIQKCLQIFKKKSQIIEIDSDERTGIISEQLGPEIKRNQEEMKNIRNVDYSVQEHKKFVVEKCLNTTGSLVIRELTKAYPTDNGQKNTIALKSLSLQINNNEIFGLLGPNGAGKTTLISVLTGMYPQSSGNAWIAGSEIGYASTNKLIGVCPQFDLLWSDLTVQEHLVFYSKLKNISEVQKGVEISLKDVDLEQWRTTKSSQLSGGMQRRLSIAIALVGNPQIVFLDEPSSGLDPYHKRQIWNILLRCKQKTSILLTSHLMEEVEVLCERIGIIHQGQLRCIGKIQDLKERFGKGYRLSISYINILRSNQENTKTFMLESLIRKFKAEIVNQLDTRVVLKVDKKDVLSCINELKKYEECSWSVNQPSLYDVFMHFIK